MRHEPPLFAAANGADNLPSTHTSSRWKNNVELENLQRCAEQSFDAFRRAISQRTKEIVESFLLDSIPAAEITQIVNKFIDSQVRRYCTPFDLLASQST
jgi:hypothetical protein